MVVRAAVAVAVLVVPAVRAKRIRRIEFRDADLAVRVFVFGIFVLVSANGPRRLRIVAQRQFGHPHRRDPPLRLF